LHKKSAMKRLQVFLLITSLTFTSFVYGQLKPYEFGKGFRYANPNGDFSIKFGLRFQSLFIADWNIRKDDLGYVEGLGTNFLVRRARLKFDGHAFSKKLKYKMELGLTNRDNGISDFDAQGGGANMMLDAYFDYNFYENFSLLVGQTKLPGNRERVISSANMQFVDRSLLNSRFNLDRDMGIQLSHKVNIGKSKLNQTIAISQGEGRNVTAGNTGGGLEYTYRVDFLPMGDFASKGDYLGSDLARESKPKLALGATFDINDKAARSRGNLGSFFFGDDKNYKTLYTGIADLMFKYKGFSLMGEFAIRGTDGRNPILYYADGSKAGTYFTGSAISVDAGYLCKSNYEFAVRYTKLRTSHSAVGNDENQYVLGFSKYIAGHSLKVQSDIGYQQIDGADDGLMWRLQFDFHL